jgi:hypothetical protein
MTLTQEDKDWLRDALKQTKTDLEQSMKTAVFSIGKKVSRLEHALNLVSRAARTAVVERAKKEHGDLLRQMFDDANLLLLAPMGTGGDGVRARGPVGCDTEKVAAFVKEYDDGFDVELNRTVGFRLVHKSRSAQVRRKAAASLLRHGKGPALDTLGLNLQYDKSWELRQKQAQAHKFLTALKNDSGGLIHTKTVKGGFLEANNIRLAPEYLVPQPHRWGNLIKLVLHKIRGWGSRAPGAAADVGMLTDVFGVEFAADFGVFDLDDLPLADYEDQNMFQDMEEA